MLGFISVMNLFFWLGANFSWLMDYMLKLYRPIPLLQTNPFVIYNTALNLLLRPWSTQTTTKNCSKIRKWQNMPINCLIPTERKNVYLENLWKKKNCIALKILILEIILLCPELFFSLLLLIVDLGFFLNYSKVALF